MPIDNRDLAVGTRLVATYKKKERTAEVVQTDDGVRYRLDDGTEHKSPSSAGKAAMGGVACNGWRFWSLEGEAKPGRATKPKTAKKAAQAKPASKKPTKAKKAKKGGKGKGKGAKAASRASYGCGACGADFPSLKAATRWATRAARPSTPRPSSRSLQRPVLVVSEFAADDISASRS